MGENATAIITIIVFAEIFLDFFPSMIYLNRSEGGCFCQWRYLGFFVQVIYFFCFY